MTRGAAPAARAHPADLHRCSRPLLRLTLRLQRDVQVQRDVQSPKPLRPEAVSPLELSAHGPQDVRLT